MLTVTRALVLLGVVASAGTFADAQTRPASASRVTSTDGRVELTDPAGDVQPLVYRESVGTGPEREVKYPGFDVVKLAVSSDGKALTFAATLTAAPARAAYEVLEFYVDADNNTQTGVTHPDAATLAGVEYYGTLEACLEQPTFGTTCTGTEPKPAGFVAVVTLERFGTDWMFKDALIDMPAVGPVKEPRKTPIAGTVVQSTLDYASLGVKAGQTIRLVVREYSTGKIKNVSQGFFPEILLTLK